MCNSFPLNAILQGKVTQQTTVMVRLDLGSVALRRMRLDDIEAVKGLIKVLSFRSIPYTESDVF